MPSQQAARSDQQCAVAFYFLPMSQLARPVNSSKVISHNFNQLHIGPINTYGLQCSAITDGTALTEENVRIAKFRSRRLSGIISLFDILTKLQEHCRVYQ
jgi:hypothetical protein